MTSFVFDIRDTWSGSMASLGDLGRGPTIRIL